MTQTSKFKKQYKIAMSIIVLLVIILIGIFFLLPDSLYPPNVIKNFLPNNNSKEGSLTKKREQTFVQEAPRNPDECELLKSDIADEKIVLGNKNYRQRFENLHFKKDGETYRTREFLDNGPEGDFLVYLVYYEDLEENTSIMENSKRKPGKMFLEFKKFVKDNPTSVIFQERGYESDIDDHYMIFQDGKISGFQGKFKNVPVECHFLE